MTPSESTIETRTFNEIRFADKNLRYEQLLSAAKRHPPITMAIVHPCQKEAVE